MEDNKCFEARENVLKFQEELLNIKSFENEMKEKEKEIFIKKKNIEDDTKVSYVFFNTTKYTKNLSFCLWI